MASTAKSLLGRCRCGEILTFPLTRVGYKRVCPRCRSVVRLNPNLRERSSKSRRPQLLPGGEGGESSGLSIRCSCGELIELLGENPPPLVVCPACQNALSLPTTPAESGAPSRRARAPAKREQGEQQLPASDRKTQELSAKELAELSRELSVAASPQPDSDASWPQAGPAWEQGLRVCEDCGELLGLGAHVCRRCGHRQRD